MQTADDITQVDSFSIFGEEFRSKRVPVKFIDTEDEHILMMRL